MHYDAIKDGIRFEPSIPYDPTKYYSLCCICGTEVMTFSYNSGKKYICKECKLINKLSGQQEKIEEDKVVKEKKLANAIKRINKMYGTLEYDGAIAKVKDTLHTYGWYQSTEEIMVAIELYKRDIPFRHQVKMGNRYYVDFMLPEHKIVLEVDGVIFHSGKQKFKDEIRDDLIIISLGPEWEIIRINDSLVNENITRIIPKVLKVCKRRKELKQENGGFLPEWYNRQMGSDYFVK